MDETEVFSLENSMSTGTLAPEEAALARRYARALVATAYRGAPRTELDAIREKVRGKSWAFEPPPASDHYWAFSRRIADFDPATCWREVSAPAFLVYGEGDERVPGRRSATRISEAYLASKGVGLTVRFFEGADHTFRLRSDQPGRFAWPRSAPGYPDVVIDWVVRVTAPKTP